MQAITVSTQQASVFLSGASGGILALGSVIQASGSQIINNSASKDTAAVYSQALESRITSSGVIGSKVGDAIRLQDKGYNYQYSSGGFIILDPESTFDVHLQNGSVVEGGSEGAGIKTTGGNTSTIIIERGATLGALSDVAIDVTGYDFYYLTNSLTVNTHHFDGAETKIINAGTIDGVIRLSSGKDTVINDTSGVWNVRQWSDSNRDGIRDTFAAVATSEFGGGSTLLTNRGIITLEANPDGSPNTAVFNHLKTFSNEGSLKLTNDVAGDRFIIDGDYAGNGGVIELDTVLGDDLSATDSVIITGSTSGQSNVIINNLNGAGAQTVNGIKVIEVHGASAGTFSQKGRIVGGAYEYYLQQNGLSNEDGDWYLRSELPSSPTTTNPEPPESPVGPAAPTAPVEPVAPTVPVTPNKPSPQPVVRPEPGSYMFNHMAANTLFQSRLHDRLGETQYTEAMTGEQKVTSLWLRQTGGHNRSHDGSGQLKNQGNRYVTQIGGDIAQWSSDGLDRWHAGLMAGYARQNSNTESTYSHYKSRGMIEGYSAGIYGTWYANAGDKTGGYVDTWALYNWFDNEVNGEQMRSEKYKSHGLTASVEAGYTFKIGANKSTDRGYFVQPQVQLTWMGVKSDTHTEHASSGSSRVKFDGDDNVQSRVGVRAYINDHSKKDESKDRQFQPFVEANWIHNTKNFGTNINGVKDSIDGTRNVAEVKIGLEGQLSRQMDVWGNIAQQVGGSGYSDSQAMLGLKYRF